MLRKSTPASSMQKTYDECYLICSTAIYFEGQNNEGEALRAWRNALDQIYYHNAYKMPSSYQPRTETEKALQDSLRSMELQCKERVDLLDALRKSRKEAEQEGRSSSDTPSKSRESLASIHKPANGEGATWLGNDTVPQAACNDLPRPSPVPERRPPPPPRPSYISTSSATDDVPRALSMVDTTSANLAPPSVSKVRARTPSPEKKAGGMLKTLRANPKDRSSGKIASSLRTRPPPAAARAASQVWAPQQQRLSTSSNSSANGNSSTTMTWDPYTRSLVERPATTNPPLRPSKRPSENPFIRPPSPSDYLKSNTSSSSLEEISKSRSNPLPYPDHPSFNPSSPQSFAYSDESVETVRGPPPPPPPHKPQSLSTSEKERPSPQTLNPVKQSSLSYMKEYPNHPPIKKSQPNESIKRSDQKSGTDEPMKKPSSRTSQAKSSPTVPRKAVQRATGVASASREKQKLDATQTLLNRRVKTDTRSNQRDDISSSPEPPMRQGAKRMAELKSSTSTVTPPSSDESPDEDQPSTPTAEQEWESKTKHILKHLPKGVDETAAKQIFNEIVIKGDEVHWDDVAGLEPAKSALKETVVYPFLRPDLFMGLREPARGMLLFGPPGTGKTMLARAVATESKSVFFAISASSLTSKYLGESEKLVRALFSLAKALAPSIIFVDEIDSILGSRGGSSEHEATRRIKTEFLIQWSDLQKAAAGRDDKEGDATRVLVLAATNLPWAIDEAARRRFVRRQYIPLPEDSVREQQLRTLLAAQKHSLRDRDLKVLVKLTDCYSGSDITALAKDAAMGPLRSLGEKLLNMSPDDIRPIGMQDFEASLVNIRPSVGRQGLKEYEDWARDFGERGG